MDGWQMECCGTPFRTGDEVSWRLRNPNPTELSWLDTVLHDGTVATIDAVEGHHADSSAPPTAGTVASIATLHCRFVSEPVAGSGIVTPIVAAQKWNSDLDDRQFVGFLIHIHATALTKR
jgi:hypothetical protein